MITSNTIVPTSIAGTTPDITHLFSMEADTEARDACRFNLPNPDDLLRRFEQNDQETSIDLEHASEIKAPKREKSPAIGQATELKVHGDGAWGAAHWTDRSRNLIEAGAYRLLPPVFMHDESGKIKRLVSVTSTNRPILPIQVDTGEL